MTSPGHGETSKTQKRTGVGLVQTVHSECDLTPEWFDAILRLHGVLYRSSVCDVHLEPIGSGQMARMLRATLSYSESSIEGSAPRSVVVKFPSTDANSLGLADAMRMYELEVRFYRDVAPLLGHVELPMCYYAGLGTEPTAFTLVLDDLSRRARPGDVLNACTLHQCQQVMAQLGRFQAALWNSPLLDELNWLADRTPALLLFDSLAAGLEPFLERFGSGLPPEHLDLFESALPKASQWVRGWQPPTVLQHGDFRSDNILFGIDGAAPPATLIDFQTIRTGPPGVDAAYFVGSALSTPDRRSHEYDLVRAYHGELVTSGVTGWDASACWESYREGALYAVLMFVGVATRIESTERGDRLIADQVRRYADMAIDLESLQVAGLGS